MARASKFLSQLSQLMQEGGEEMTSVCLYNQNVWSGANAIIFFSDTSYL